MSFEACLLENARGTAEVPASYEEIDVELRPLSKTAVQPLGEMESLEEEDRHAGSLERRRGARVDRQQAVG